MEFELTRSFRATGTTLSRTSSLHPAEVCAAATVSVATSPSSGLLRRSWHGRGKTAVTCKLDQRFLSSSARSSPNRRPRFPYRDITARWMRSSSCNNCDRSETDNSSNHLCAQNSLLLNNSLSTTSTDSTLTQPPSWPSLLASSDDSTREPPSLPSSPRYLRRSPLSYTNSYDEEGSVFEDTLSPPKHTPNRAKSTSPLLQNRTWSISAKQTSPTTPLRRAYSSRKQNRNKNNENPLTPNSRNGKFFLGRSTPLAEKHRCYGNPSSLSGPASSHPRYSIKINGTKYSSGSSHKESYV